MRVRVDKEDTDERMKTFNNSQSFTFFFFFSKLFSNFLLFLKSPMALFIEPSGELQTQSPSKGEVSCQIEPPHPLKAFPWLSCDTEVSTLVANHFKLRNILLVNELSSF